MEILNTTVSESPIILLLLGVAFLLMATVFLFAIIKDRDSEGIGVVVVFLALGILSTWGYFGLPDEVSYEVLITDFNEVYEQGYKIVGQRGDIYIIQEVG